MIDTVVWVPDERVHECMDCRQRFSHFRRKVRRHHSRGALENIKDISLLLSVSSFDFVLLVRPVSWDMWVTKNVFYTCQCSAALKKQFQWFEVCWTLFIVTPRNQQYIRDESVFLLEFKQRFKPRNINSFCTDSDEHPELTLLGFQQIFRLQFMKISSLKLGLPWSLCLFIVIGN